MLAFEGRWAGQVYRVSSDEMGRNGAIGEPICNTDGAKLQIFTATTGCFVGFCAGAGWLLCFLAEGRRDCGDVAFGSLAENKKTMRSLWNASRGGEKNARDFTRTGDLFQTVGLGAEAVDLGFVGGEDDIDVADVTEIGAEHDIEAIALAVG